MGWHIVITDEMRALGLTGNDLLVYALIHGFSQNGQGCFYGSISYICETCGIARRTAIYILNNLVEQGFIDKTETIKNNVRTVSYQCKNCTGGVQKLHRGSAEIAPNNKDIDISTNVDNNTIRGFSFKNELLGLGVSVEVADAWLAIRKRKKAVNSEIAFKGIQREIEKSGLTADQAIRIAVEKSWCGFEAAWLDKPSTKQQPNKFEQIKEVISRNPYRR